VHFSTFSVVELNCGAPYGQAWMQFLHPVQASLLIRTIPSSARLKIALFSSDGLLTSETGQEAIQAGCSQWLQALVMNNKLGTG
jgi:hypothetical protein